jgi:hypothetical protein
MFGVGLCGFVMVMFCVCMMSVSQMSVVPRFFMVTAFVMLGSFMMMLGCFLMMFRCMTVMFGSFFCV